MITSKTRPHSILAAVLIAFLIALPAAQAALASAGGYDCSFGDFGKTAGGSGMGKAIDIYDSGPQQGKILVTLYVNDFKVMRLNADGSLDTGFGAGGYAPTVDFAGSWDYANGVAGLADGSVVIAGQASYASGSNFYNRLAAVRYTAAGALDATFGTGGKFVQKMSATDKDEFWNDAVADSSGNTYVAGKTIDASGFSYSTVVKLSSAGAVSGVWNADFTAGTYDEVFNAIVLQSDGKIVAGGSYYDNAISKRLATVARFTTAGALDTTFSGDGKMTFTLSSIQDEVRDLALDGSGNILAGFDTAPAASTYDFAVARITTSGSLDGTFNTTGMTTPKHVNLYDFPYAVLVQSDGKIVLGGSANASSGAQAMTLLRYTSAGSLDASFGSSGVLQVETSGGSAVYGLAQQTNGKILVAGYNSAGAAVLSLHDLDFDMRYGASRLSQISDPTYPGMTDQEIMHIQVCMDGLTNPINLTGVEMSTTGSTDASDIDAARLYSTTDGAFATGTQFGGDASTPSGLFSITGSQAMLTGANHLWLAYDISDAADGSAAHVVDASLEGLSFSGSGGSVTPAVTTAAGSREIQVPVYADNTYFWITNVTLNTLDNDSAADSNGYGDYSGLSTTLDLDTTYALTVTMEFSGYGSESVSAFFDWNGDGDFTDTGEDYPIVVSAAENPPDYVYYSQTDSIEITVPAGAVPGSSKFMIVSDWGVLPSSTGNQSGYGEAELYSLTLDDNPTAVALKDFSGRSSLPIAPLGGPAMFLTAGLGAFGLLVLRKRS